MKQIYFSRLDALRSFAFFVVFWQHGLSQSLKSLDLFDSSTLMKLTMTGGYGVHIFFVLSGFLITLLLLKEFDQEGNISVKNFYIRRILRIWPIYYLVMLLGIFILPELLNTLVFCGDTFKNLLFLNNFDISSSCESPNVAIAWSVAIEEQFYLVWPVLFFFVAKKLKILVVISLCIFIASIVFININPDRAYFHTLGNLNNLMVGCIGAILFFKQPDFFKNLFFTSKWSFIGIFLLFCFSISLNWPFQEILHPLIFLWLILFLVKKDELSVSNSIFSRLGKYTYGMYMYHPILIIFCKMIFDRLDLDYLNQGGYYLLMGTIALILTIVLSIISYEYFEKKILRFKSHFSTVKTRI